jgi:hypothetical protein
MSNQLQITGGAKVRSLEGVITGTTGVLGSLPINTANGIPQLDSSGKILVSQLPNSVMEYKGTWNANTNTPTLANGTGNQGDVWLCNVAGTTDFGAGPITFVVGDSAIYSGSIWQRAGGATGTVTSVGVSRDGNALTITGSPITTSGTINLGFSGTSAQYINGAGSLTTFPTLISSIGLTMPSAFSVANSPLTANGTLAVTGAGNASQYIRGDGTLAAYNPSTGGGGSSQTFYFNGSVASSVVGYEQMSTTANTGTSTDFTISADGYIASFLTDVNSPNQLNIPAGNWNFEIYMNSNSAGGSPSFYVELYKYASSTFTLIATSSANPEYITNGTAVDLYITALAVPATVLTVTDRLAVRVYVTHSSKTITMHTQDSNLSSVITTFSTGITALNGLTAQVQYFQTGTSGTDFAISSATATHTFNLPTASASADWSTFNSKESALTFSSPLVRTTNTISIPAATTSVNGYLTSTDWTTFNGKQNAINGTGFVKATGTYIYFDNSTYVTGVTGTSPIVSSGGGAPAISIPVATTYVDGYLSHTDWNTFNNKASASGASGRVAFYNGSNSLTSDSYFYFDSTYKRLGLGDFSALTITAKFSSISTTGAWYNRNTSSAVYNGLGLYYDATYGHLFQTDKASTASEALITFVNNLSTFTIDPNGYVGINTINPMPQISGGGGKGLDIYGGAGYSVLALHNDASGTTNTDGARLYLTTTNVILRNYESGNLSILADTGDVILQAGIKSNCRWECINYWFITTKCSNIFNVKS